MKFTILKESHYHLLPNTPIVRKTMARFHDCVTAMDKEVGNILDQLKKDDMEENTIVFFFSDHGSGMPRHKRALLDSGMHVPLLVRFPKKWQHLAEMKPGQTSKELVTFVDFGPTILNLTGTQVPSYIQEGIPWDGTTEKRTYVSGHRDRVDGVRICPIGRDKRYLYSKLLYISAITNQLLGQILGKSGMNSPEPKSKR